MNIVRENLMNRKGYTPYCGNIECRFHMPRTRYIGGQFQCGCGWRSSFEAEFIEVYEAKWAAPAPAQRECSCFGESGLHASTHVPIGSDREHCDLCGYPVPAESTDVLSAINAPPQTTDASPASLVPGYPLNQKGAAE